MIEDMQKQFRANAVVAKAPAKRRRLIGKHADTLKAEKGDMAPAASPAVMEGMQAPVGLSELSHEGVQPH